MLKKSRKFAPKSSLRGRGATNHLTTQVFHNKWLLILVSFLVLFTLGLGVVLCIIGVSKSPFMAVSGPTNVDYWTDSADYYNTNWLGEGTIDAPYEIHTAADLAGLSYAVYSGTAEVKNGDYYYQNTYFKQMADIDLSAHYWRSIGGYIGGLDYPKFAGNYDGGNFTISGVFTVDTSSYVGLFGYVYGEENNIVTIKNIKIIDSYIAGKQDVGAIIGNAGYTEISNCYNYADVKATSSNSGGIVGGAYISVITDCQNFGFIDGDDYCGGIVGRIDNTGCRVYNCVNNGEIEGGQYTGGIAGRVECDIILCSNTNSVSGSGYVGGIVGQKEVPPPGPPDTVQKLRYLGEYLTAEIDGAVHIQKKKSLVSQLCHGHLPSPVWCGNIHDKHTTKPPRLTSGTAWYGCFFLTYCGG